jgi:predicted flap endonuclease-1-like 5' DNA nuclease
MRQEQQMTNPTPTDPDLPKIGNPATRALATIGITRLDQLPAYSAKEILALHGMGPKGIRILREALAERGLSFKGEA